LLLLLVSLTLLLAVPAIEGVVITVEQDGSGDFNTIADAVNNSTSGDEIVVGPGNYSGYVYINNSITLRTTHGTNKTFFFPEYVEGSQGIVTPGYPEFHSPIIVDASNVTIKGFTFSVLPTDIPLNFSTAIQYRATGHFIRVFTGKDLLVSENRFLVHPNASLAKDIRKGNHVMYGISIGYPGSDIIIENNSAEYLHTLASFAYGYNHVIQNNSITKCEYGILIGNTRSTTIQDNMITDCVLGIEILGSNDLKITHNEFTDNYLDITGGGFMDSEIRGNTFLDSDEPDFAGVGFLLSDSNMFTISDNRFINKTKVSLSEVTNFTLINNTFDLTELTLHEFGDVTGSLNVMDGKPIEFITNRKFGDLALAGAAKIYVVNCEMLNITDVSISGREIGITIVNSTSITIGNSSFGNMSSAGIFVKDSQYCVVHKCDFLNGTFGVFVEDSFSIEINDCQFTEVFAGMQIKRSNLSAVRDSLIMGGRDGVIVVGSYLGVIESNDFHDLEHGVNLQESSRMFISYNIFENCVVSGILIKGGHNNSLAENNCIDGVTGIELITSPDCFIRDNLIHAFSHYGLAINSSSSGATVTGNIITGLGDTGYGISMDFSDSVVLESNFITRNGYGIYIENSSSCNLTQNNLSKNIRGVYLYGNVYFTLVENNSFSDNTFGADAEFAKGIADMRWNYWGDPSGPYHPQNNSHGLGDRVSDNILVEPYQLIPGDPKIPEKVEKDEEDIFIWDLTWPQFAIMIVDLTIVLGVAGLYCYIYIQDTKNDREREEKKKSETEKKEENETAVKNTEQKKKET